MGSYETDVIEEKLAHFLRFSKVQTDGLTWNSIRVRQRKLTSGREVNHFKVVQARESYAQASLEMSWVAANCVNCQRLYHRANGTTARRSWCLECLETQLNKLENDWGKQEDELHQQKDELDMFHRKLSFLGYKFDSDAADGEGDTKIIIGGRRDEPLFAHKLILVRDPGA